MRRPLEALAAASGRWWKPSTQLALAGAGALAIGALVYMADRSPERVALLPAFLALGTGPLFGVLGQWLPSFFHPLAFSLFSASLLTPRMRWQYAACAFWLAVNVACEIGQHPQVRGPLADALRHRLGHGPVARALENYFLHGTFDPCDLVAAALGTALAAGILHCLCAPSDKHHAR